MKLWAETRQKPCVLQETDGIFRWVHCLLHLFLVNVTLPLFNRLTARGSSYHLKRILGCPLCALLAVWLMNKNKKKETTTAHHIVSVLNIFISLLFSDEGQAALCKEQRKYLKSDPNDNCCCCCCFRCFVALHKDSVLLTAFISCLYCTVFYISCRETTDALVIRLDNGISCTAHSSPTVMFTAAVFRNLFKQV